MKPQATRSCPRSTQTDSPFFQGIPKDGVMSSHVAPGPIRTTSAANATLASKKRSQKMGRTLTLELSETLAERLILREVRRQHENRHLERELREREKGPTHRVLEAGDP